MASALVVDDSRAIRMILTRTLADLGMKDVCQAGNGKEALAELEKRPDVSLALVDWNMPEMNGLEFVRAVRADGRYRDLKVVMVTTETQVEQMMTALEAGANEYIMKPFTNDIIADKLRMVGAL